jgi:hypothetical protein
MRSKTAKKYYKVDCSGGMPQHVAEFYADGEKQPELANWDAWLPSDDGKSVLVCTDFDLSGPGVTAVRDKAEAQTEYDRAKGKADYLKGRGLQWL